MAETLGHGSVGKHELAFTQLLPSRGVGYDVTKLAGLADAMAGIPDSLSDGGDPEENLYVPAGYTYFGQFIDHDLTFDTTSTLDMSPAALANPNDGPSTIRSPRFDLDCVYGNGPGDAPFLYAGKDGKSRGIAIYGGASLLLGGDGATMTLDGTSINNDWDLLRGPNARALIGDKRNDENSIVNQIQQLFILFHNKVVATLVDRTPAFLGDRGALFDAARDQVRWAYQKLIVEDFLPRIIDARVLDQFRQSYAVDADKAYQLYKPGAMRINVPREFAAAAYRYGHSGVRQGYRLNATTIRSIFLADPLTGKKQIDSLVGFEPLPGVHAIDDWARFFPLDSPRPGERRLSNSDPSVDIEQDDPSLPDPETGKPPGDPKVRLQYAYKLDPSLVEPLIVLPSVIASLNDVQPPSLRLDKETGKPKRGPSLALLNLLRGNRYLIPGGQSFEPLVDSKLDPERYLRVRQLVPPKNAADPKTYTFVHIRDVPDVCGVPLGNVFTSDTPLWFYILAEAQKPVVDLWYAGGCVALTENQLMGLDEKGEAYPPIEPPDPAATAKQLAETRAGGTQLGAVGGRIITEVFYGLLDSDSDSLVNRAPGGIAGFDPIWTPQFGRGAATMARLIQFTATPENGLKISKT